MKIRKYFFVITFHFLLLGEFLSCTNKIDKIVSDNTNEILNKNCEDFVNEDSVVKSKESKTFLDFELGENFEKAFKHFNNLITLGKIRKSSKEDSENIKNGYYTLHLNGEEPYIADISIFELNKKLENITLFFDDYDSLFLEGDNYKHIRIERQLYGKIENFLIERYGAYSCNDPSGKKYWFLGRRGISLGLDARETYDRIFIVFFDLVRIIEHRKWLKIRDSLEIEEQKRKNIMNAQNKRIQDSLMKIAVEKSKVDFK